ncbi:MAG TPA: SURF1 family protein [Ilumatobacteraceae bacterium]|nr:SURF1 family protein [Ilumatobacteraceae bacterium]
MYRFLIKPKWLLFHLFCVLMMVAMVNLGLWQLRRLDERRDFNATVKARTEQEVVPLDDIVPPGEVADTHQLEYRPVEVSGSYLPDLSYERSVRRDDMAGRDLFGVLQLDDGSIVVVNRGWLSDGIPSPALPEGTVRLVARLRVSATNGTGQVGDTGTEPMTIFRVDVRAIGDDAGAQPRAMYVERITSDPAEPAEMTPVPFPDLGEGPHFGYAVQWFLFTLGVVVCWALAVARKVGELKNPPDPNAIDPDAPAY